MRVFLVMLLLPILGACSTPFPDGENSGSSIREGRYEEAYSQYTAAVDRSPDNPLLRQKAELARSAILKRQIDAARTAEKRGRLDRAIEELRGGLAYDTRGIVRDEIERLRSKMSRVESELSEARRLAAAGENRKAGAILASIAPFQPTFPQIRDLTNRVNSARAADRAHSLRADADAILARARDEFDDGRVGSALAALQKAGAPVKADPQFRTESGLLRDRIRARLLRESGEHRRAGRVATALLYARSAAVADPGDAQAQRDVASLGAEVAGKYAISMRLDPFVDGTGGRVDPRRFTGQVGSVIGRSTSCPWVKVVPGGGSADLGVSGAVTALNVVMAPTRTVRKVHQYSEGVEQDVNPEHEWLEGKVQSEAERLEEAEKRLEEIEWELFYLERLEGRVTVLNSGRRRFGDYSEAAYYRVLGDARRREAGIRRFRDAAAKKLAGLQDRLDQTPLYVEREIVGEVPYDEETVGKLATARGTFRIVALREIPGFRTRTGDVAAEAGVTDRVTAGRPEVGLNPDPDELPSDARLAREALGDLADEFAGEIGRKVAALRLGLIPDARRLEADGDLPGALEQYAAFALGAGEMFPLEQANASMRIWENYEIEVSGRKLDLTGLKLD